MHALGRVTVSYSIMTAHYLSSHSLSIHLVTPWLESIINLAMYIACRMKGKWLYLSEAAGSVSMYVALSPGSGPGDDANHECCKGLGHGAS